MLRSPFTLFLVPAAACACFAQQWTAIVLHPPGGARSDVFAVNATHQGGWYTPSEPFAASQAGLWSGSAQSWTAFSPLELSSELKGMDGTRQVGFVSGEGAVLWTGAPASRISLHPPGAVTSIGLAIRGTMQAGVVNYPGAENHAAMWRDTPQSFVDLHPTGAVRSQALATDGLVQGGWIDWPVGAGSRTLATLWNGTPESFIILGPTDRQSRIHGMAPGVQVGEVQAPFGNHAALWRGTPESLIDMHPPGQSGTSIFFATTGWVHAGLLTSSGLARAAVNFGTPDAWLGLHQFLPPQYTTFSRALAVHQEDSTIYVGGYAVNPQTGAHEALLWIGAIPPQYCYANCDQSTSPPYLNIDDFICFINQFASAQPLPHAQQLSHRANCDQSTTAPVLNVDDFTCFINAFAQGCP